MVLALAAAVPQTVFAASSGTTIDLSDNNPPSSGTGWTFNNGTHYTIANNANVTVTGTTTTKEIEVKGGGTASITLNNANINSTGGGWKAAFTITENSTVNLTLQGDNIIQVGTGQAGINVPLGSTLIITAESTGSLKAFGSTYTGAAGIGCKWDDSRAGIIKIEGGVVTATGNIGIGCTGSSNEGNSFLHINGNGVVVLASSLSINSTATVGILFNGNTGTFYGASVTPASSFEIPSGKTLIVGSGKTLTIKSGVTLTNSGTLTNNSSTIRVQCGGTFINNGTFLGNHILLDCMPATPAINTIYTPTLTLSDLSLPAGYTWKMPSTSLNAGDGQTFPATYRDGPYAAVDGEITVNVAKAAGNFGNPSALNVTYRPNLTLSSLTLPSGYAWIASNPSLSAGVHQCAAIYTDPSGNYSATGVITVNVAKATPTAVAFPTAAAITYGAALSTSALTGGTGDGTFAWTDGTVTPIVTNSGYQVTFTPNNANDYDYSGVALTATVQITVAKATGSFGSPSALDITYMPTLKLSDLSLPTGYAWNAPSTTITSAGDGQTFPATFTDPSGNYNSATGSITVNVAKATGNFGNPPALNATYTPTLKLSDLTLPSGYAWVNGATSLNAGDGQLFAATYTSGNYEAATGNITVNVAKRNLSNAAIASIPSFTYNGSAHTPAPSVSDGNIPITASDYTISYANNINAGTATLTITATSNGNYTGTKTATFQIVPQPPPKRDLSNATIAEIAPLVYNGLEQRPVPSASDGNTTITAGNYTVSYANNKNAGTATLTLTATASGNYAGTKTATFEITKKALTITAEDKTATQGDNPPAYTATYSGFATGETASNLGGKLVFNCDYSKNSPVGAYAITPSGYTSGNYEITYKSGTLTVVMGKRDLSNATIAEIAPLVYNGLEQRPVPSVSDGNIPITAGNYTINYANNKDAGTATLTLTAAANSNYTGTKTATFEITKKALTITADSISIIQGELPEYTATYSGFANGENESALTGTLEFSSGYTPESNAGKYIITPSGYTSGNYEITYKTGILTVKRDLSNAAIADIAPLIYNGSEQTPVPSVSDGNMPITASDYTVSYANNKNVGTATLTLTAAASGNYIGTKTATFEITKKALAITANNITTIQGNKPPQYTATYSGLANGETASALTGTLEFNSGYTPESDVGEYDIIPYGLSSGNYEITFAKGIITVVNIIVNSVKESIPFDKDGEHRTENKILFATSNCEAANAGVIITPIGPDIELDIVNKDNLNLNIGLDTLVYNLVKKGAIVRQGDTAIIVTPFPFDKIIKQKWGVLIVNSDPSSNGGYNLTEYKWFKNGEETGTTRAYYSPEPGEKLNPADLFNVELKTEENIRLNTCEGSPTAQPPPEQPNAYKKQVLGINGKTASGKVYNINGKIQPQTPPPGVYIVEEEQ